MFVYLLYLIFIISPISESVGGSISDNTIGTNLTHILNDTTIISKTPSDHITKYINETTVGSSINSEMMNFADLIAMKYNSSTADQDYDYEITMPIHVRNEFAKQLGLPNNPGGVIVRRLPCQCRNGICGCCTGFLLNIFRSKACMNITYIPEEFAFEVKMLMNDHVLYKNMISGRNPRPICVRPPRLDFIKMCAKFNDVYFIGRNMHFCLSMEASLGDYDIFDRSFNCLRIGDQGVKIVKPEDGGGIYKPGVDADIDAGGGDDIEDYDENLVRQIAGALF